MMKPLTAKQVVIWSFTGAVVFELLTLAFRFGFDMQWAHESASTVGVLTCGIRIHHGYVGVLVVVAAMFCRKARPALSRWLLVAGVALVASDLIHHFAILWPIVGSPEFDLVY